MHFFILVDMGKYEKAGVSIDAGNDAVARIKKHVKSTHGNMVIGDFANFAGVVSLKKFAKMKEPLLVSTMDGVGTKIKIASAMGKWDTVGQDIVNHCSNDILPVGASPLFFLDYVAASKISPEKVEQIVAGMAKACREVGCSLIGGETAEMPSVYAQGEYDIAGCMVGIVDRKDAIGISKIKPGDEFIALPSNGLHTNGYSLARKVLLTDANLGLNDKLPGSSSTLGGELLKVHKSYSKAVLALMEKKEVLGIAHITGGGIPENLPRILPKGICAEIERPLIKVQPIFRLIQEKGGVSESEMYRVFNMGVGLVIAVPKGMSSETMAQLRKLGQDSYYLGKAAKGSGVKFK